MSETLNFSQALTCFREGAALTRLGWLAPEGQSKKPSVVLQEDLTDPRRSIFIQTQVYETRNPNTEAGPEVTDTHVSSTTYYPSIEDLLATDWSIVS